MVERARFVLRNQKALSQIEMANAHLSETNIQPTEADIHLTEAKASTTSVLGGTRPLTTTPSIDL